MNQIAKNKEVQHTRDSLQLGLQQAEVDFYLFPSMLTAQIENQRQLDLERKRREKKEKTERLKLVIRQQKEKKHNLPPLSGSEPRQNALPLFQPSTKQQAVNTQDGEIPSLSPISLSQIMRDVNTQLLSEGEMEELENIDVEQVMRGVGVFDEPASINSNTGTLSQPKRLNVTKLETGNEIVHTVPISGGSASVEEV